ncbi:hypothetical protein FB555_001443 [Alpinimonas psychrophila]|uniref:Uncharacterized protein n=1 Tax=Alpinimonas psychrophila TaxID=748908 RepID=A0A7W3PPJ8_9MICO|nr:hypothetical protein [Alpinimonas psychrophila]
MHRLRIPTSTFQTHTIVTPTKKRRICRIPVIAPTYLEPKHDVFRIWVLSKERPSIKVGCAYGIVPVISA